MQNKQMFEAITPATPPPLVCFVRRSAPLSATTEREVNDKLPKELSSSLQNITSPKGHATEDYPRNLAEYEARFSTDVACREYLVRLRWPEDFGALDAVGGRVGRCGRFCRNA
jgi:hypothetical protein